MSTQTKKTLKRSVAVLLSGLMATGSLLTSPIAGLLGTSITASAAALTGNDTDGYSVNMPVSGNDTLDLSDKATGFTFKLYDDGGPGSNYSDNCNGTLAIRAPLGKKLMIWGDFTLENKSFDYFELYDGSSTSATKIGDKFGTSNSGSTESLEAKLSSDNNLTILFRSDGSGTYSGLDLTVQIVDPSVKNTITVNKIGEGSLTSDKASAVVGETVTITAVPVSGGVVQSITVTDSNGNPVKLTSGGDWRSNTATFVMPMSAVTVNGVLVSEATAENGISINMYKTETQTLQLTDNIHSLMIYDDGGIDGYASQYCSSHLNITAPEGCYLELSGTIAGGGDYDYIEVYDYNYSYSSRIMGTFRSSLDGSKTDIPVCLTTDRYISIYYATDSENRDGLELTLKVIRPTLTSTITCAPSEHGSVSVVNNTAAVNTEVSFTASNSSGWYLKEVLATYTDTGDSIPVNGGSWSDGNAGTFNMPARGVTLTPVFTTQEDALVRIPVDYDENGDVMRLTIPEGMECFNVYDSCDENNRYVDGGICFTAPEGKILELSGSCVDFQFDGKVTVIDGSILGTDNIIGEIRRTNNNSTFEIAPYLSTSRSMIVRFKTNSYSLQKLNLKIRVLNPSTKYTITKNIAEHGSFTVSATKAAANTQVTVTATPDNGYHLEAVNVTAYDGKTWRVSGGRWCDNNTATFLMPASAASVTPVFASDESGFYINMPLCSEEEINLPLSVPSFSLYDDGGKDSNRTGKSTSVLTLVAPSGYILSVSGEVYIDSYDTLYIYNGASTESDLLGEYKGTASVDSVVCSGQSMTLKLDSQSTSGYTGLILTVSLVDTSIPHTVTVVNDNNDGTISSNYSQATVNMPVTITAQPKAGKALNSVTVTTESGKSVAVTGGGWYSDNKATFIMPVENVTVTATYIDSNNLSINIPKNEEELQISIPAGVSSFKVYDDGGPDSSYSNNISYHKLIFSAPENCTFSVEGTCVTESGYDYVNIYDGDLKLGGYTGGSEDEPLIIEKMFITEGSTLTVEFRSDGSGVGPGFELTVNVFRNDPHTITLKTATGGTLSTDETSVKGGKQVTITADPDDKYVIKYVRIVDSDGNNVDFTGGTWYDNTIKFIMPRANVTVTPVFTKNITADNGLSVNAGYFSDYTINVPNNTKSFMIYDYAGSDASMTSNTCYINLVAPEGYVFKFSGSYTTTADSDYFKIYDNTTYATLFNSRSSVSGEAEALEPVITTGKAKLMLYSNAYDAPCDMAVKVELINTSKKNTVTVKAGTNGTAAADKTTAAINEVVTITATPDSGYMLKDVVVTDASGKSVYTTDDHLNNKVSFKMPDTAVTVSYSFTNTLTFGGGLYVKMGRDSYKSITVPSGVTSFRIYDDGGKDGKYTNTNSGLKVTLPDGYGIKLTGTVAVDRFNSSLNVYKTLNTYSENSVGSFTSSDIGVATDIGAAYVTGNTFSLLLMNLNNTAVYDGLNLVATLYKLTTTKTVTVQSATGGTVTADKTKSTIGDVITLTAAPNNGYLLKDITVKDSNGKTVKVNGGTWKDNKATFVLPNLNVTVTPVFTNALTAEDGLYLNMSTNADEAVTIPAGVQSFMVYDDGGKDGRYSLGESYLTLTAPDGYFFRYSGSTATEDSNYYSLYIYDGGVNSGRSYSYGRTQEISEQSFVNNKMAFRFRASSPSRYYAVDASVAGFAVKVELVQATETHNITCNSATGGYVTPSTESAVMGTAIGLTFVPESNYILKSVSVRTNSGYSIEFSGGTWYSNNAASFNMPNTNVTVTPQFTNDLSSSGGLSINVPAGKSMTVDVPEGVNSFNITGGGENSALVINAPQGNIIMITGSDSFFAVSSDNHHTINYGGKTATLTAKIANATTAYSITKQNCTNGQYTVTVNGQSSDTACPGQTVTVTAVPDEGYVLDAIYVNDENDDYVLVDGGYWYTDNTATFNMVPANVKINVAFEEGTPYVCTPEEGGLNIAIPEGITEFKLFDSSGEFEYESYENGYVSMTAPAGYVLEISGFINTSMDDSCYMSIYDGGSTESTLVGRYTSIIDGRDYYIPNIVSSGRSLTVAFFNNSYEVYDGLDLTVKVVSTSKVYKITKQQSLHGTISTSKTQAKPNTTITLTATPDEGYILDHFVVRDSLGDECTVKGGTWYDTSAATVKMPSSDIKVSAVFVKPDQKSINIPASGVREVTIPEGVTSFRIYDDGGKYGNYSNYAGGSLVVHLPEDFMMRVEGKLYTEYNADALLIFDSENPSDYTRSVFAYGEEGVTVQDIGPVLLGEDSRFTFTSDYDTTYRGVDLTVEVIDCTKLYDVTVIEAEHGSVKIMGDNDQLLTSAKYTYGTRVYIKAQPDTGYDLAQVIVKDSTGTKVRVYNGTWFANEYNVGYFSLPTDSVTVTALFTPKSEPTVVIPYSTTPVAVDVNIPAGTEFVKLYDDGGKDGDYSNNQQSGVRIIAPEGYFMLISGTIHGIRNKDGLLIYDGPTTNSTKYTYTANSDGSLRTLDPFVTTSNAAIFYMVSDEFETRPGVDLTIEFIDPDAERTVTIAPATHGTLTSNCTKSKYNNTVTLTATPANGYLLKDITVTDSKGNIIPVKGGTFANNTATFTMPYLAVSAQAEFTSAHTADDGLFINMPATDSETAVVPQSVTSFKLYDDGGKDNPYSKNCDGTLTLRSPEGTAFRISGGIYSYSDYRLYIFDGDAESTTYLGSEEGYGGVTYTESGYDPCPIDTVISSSNIVTLNFKTGSYTYYDGIDALVEIIDAGAEFTVTCNSSEHGSISANKSKAAFGTEVTVTSTPESGYVLNHIIATDDDGNEVVLNGGTWYSDETATFTVPYANVTLTGVFVLPADRYVDLNTYSDKMVNVPSGVTSFKLKRTPDTALQDPENYRQRTIRSDVMITLPEGNVAQVLGKAIFPVGYSNLTVTDVLPEGSEAEPEVLFAFNPQFVYYSTTGEHTEKNVPCVLSSGNSVLISTSNSYVMGYDNIDLKVNVVKTTRKSAVNVAQTEHGTISVDKETATPNELVTVIATPDEGYVLNSISVIDKPGFVRRFEGGTWYTSNTATFNMAANSVTVSAEFVKPDEAYLNLSPDLYETNVYTVPATVTRFTVYDDGGKNGNSTIGMYSYGLFTAPENYAFRLSGGIFAKPTDRKFYFTVCEGEYSYSNTIFSAYGASPSSSSYYDEPTEFLTSFGPITLEDSAFNISYDSGIDEQGGFEVVVELVPLNVLHDITVLPTEHGTVTASKDKALQNEVIGLTIAPENGYLLNSLTVETASGMSCVVTGLSWTSPTASFVMVPHDVFVKAEFTNSLTAVDGLSLNIPVAGVQEVTIPSNVKSFKVYDDGGKDKNHGNGCNGKLTLNVPTGKHLQITGTVTTEGINYDYLSIFSGDSESTTYLTIYKKYGTKAGSDIGVVFSDDSQVTLYFHSDSSITYEGVDLTVSVVEFGNTNNITVKQTEGGTILVDRAKADFGDYVVVEATPDAHYHLNKLIVTEASGATLPYEDYNDGTYSFFVYASNVTVSGDWQLDRYEVVLPDHMTFCDEDAGPDFAYGTTVKFRPEDEYGVIGKVMAGSVELKPDSNGDYSVVIGESDITVSATLDKVLTNTSYIKPAVTIAGVPTYLYTSAKNGSGGYTFMVHMKLKSETKWTVVTNYTSDEMIALNPKTEGVYDVCVRAKDSEGTIAKIYLEFTANPALSVSAVPSSETVLLNDNLTVTAQASGGVPAYSFAAYYRDTATTKWNTIANYSDNNVFNVVLPKAGSYEICVKAKDTKGTIAKTYFNVTVNRALENTSTVSSESISLGETLVITGSAVGGTGSYQYSILAKSASAASYTTLQKYGTNNVVEYVPSAEGTYSIAVKVKDGAGTIVTKKFDVTVTNELRNTSIISADAVSLGEAVVINASAIGGTGSYQYSVLAKSASASSFKTIQVYGANNVIEYVPATAEVYTIAVKVKDGAGTIVTKRFNVTVTNEFVNTSIYSADTISLGETEIVTASAQGGVGLYQYSFLVKKDTDASFTTLQKYGTNNVLEYVPTLEGVYTIAVKVKDEAGSIVTKKFNITVTNELRNTSTVNAEEISLSRGEKITVTASAQGGTGAYQYSVLAKKASDASYTTVQKYGTNNIIDYVPASEGTYSVAVKVKDAAGTIVTKKFNITVTNELLNSTTISAFSIVKGEKIRVTSAAMGGTPDYQFAVSYRRAGATKWTVVQEYSSNAEVYVKPAGAYNYEILSKVKDSTGTEVERIFNVTVTEAG